MLALPLQVSGIVKAGWLQVNSKTHPEPPFPRLSYRDDFTGVVNHPSVISLCRCNSIGEYLTVV